jgi:hypothetical protein
MVHWVLHAPVCMKYPDIVAVAIKTETIDESNMANFLGICPEPMGNK